MHFMQVSKWLGHSTFTLTLDTYGDYIREQDGGALNTLPEPPARFAPLRRMWWCCDGGLSPALLAP
jgi:integrase